VGLWDFWRWEYDYGHNLDMEKAIIIVPDMTYQPPLIGSKQLLNFTATAWPGLGTIALGISFLTGAGVWFVTRPKRAA
jgi:copper chaperone NosL